MAIVIDLKVQNRQTASTITRLEKAVERLDTVIQRLNSTLARTAGAVNSASAAVGRNGGTGAIRRRPVFNTMLDEAAWLRTQPGWRNQQRAAALQQRASRPPMNPTMAALMRTRFNAAGNGFPLGRDIMAMMRSGNAQGLSSLFGTGMQGAGGGGATAGAAKLAPALATALAPAAIPLALAAGVLLTGAAAFRTSVAAFGRLASGLAAFGGTTDQNSVVSSLSRFGANPQAFQSAIGSGIGAAYAQQAGINPLGGPFGDMNYAGKLQKYAQFVANSKSFEEARRRAEAVGMPDLANTFHLSEEGKQRLGRKSDRVLDRAGAIGSVRLGESMDRVSAAWERFSKSFMSGAGAILAATLNRVASVLEWVNSQLDKFLNWLLTLLQKLGIGKGPDAKSDRTKENTDAVRENTRALNETREVLGGGQRATGAIPRRITGHNLDQATMDRHRYALI